MATQTKKMTVSATTGTLDGNPCLTIKPSKRVMDIAEERTVAAAVYRAAAMLSERMTTNACAICVDVYRDRIHLEFGSRDGQAVQLAARAVLDAVAAEINRGVGA